MAGSRVADERSRQRFAVLDGLRGLAALAVVADHVASPTVQMLSQHRALAVDFFFVLSGFVVTHAYGARLMGPTSIGALRFIMVRAVRFWPMLLAAVALGAALTFIRDPFEYSAWRWLASLGLGLAFLPTPQSMSLSNILPFPFVGPAYTMFLELFANLVFALVAARLTNLRLALIILVSGVMLVFVSAHFGTVTVGWNYDQLWGGLPRVLFSFFVGVALYRTWRAHRIPALPTWLAFAVLLLALCTPALGAWFVPFELTMAIVVFPLLVLFSAGSRVEGVSERVMLRAGALSYGFYLLHGALNGFFESTAPKVGLSAAQLDVIMYVAVVASTIALTMALERWYEAPFRRWLARRLLPGRRAGPADAAVR